MSPWEKVKDAVMDALDVETFLVCSSEDEAVRAMRALMDAMGLGAADIVFLEMAGPGARVRARAYVHRPGDRYGWLGGEADGEAGNPGSA
ncbi:MAG: hypothetical protein NUV93_07300 [Firmicutes bacterium]|nr:hypothetical protein [Bacillota bacterium]